VNTPLLFAVGFLECSRSAGERGSLDHGAVGLPAAGHPLYRQRIHYVLFGGAIFALFGGAYYWFPKFTGKLMNETLGQINFWTLLVGFNLTFFPMHMSGLLGMPRRIYTYSEGQGWDLWNLMATIGAFVIAFSVLTFAINLVLSLARGEKSGPDPWDARTLEWSIPSPVPHYNFAEIPQVHARDDFWHRKYTEDEAGRAIPVIAGGSMAVRSTTGTGSICLRRRISR
jgi:cytochrome c oxidase subunit 1